ncbi:MAG: hypothetical protein HRT58_05590 [Crocinitomicaceae bacterium]|nr:hypothetical protein [Flavobacteriales bacterium]NQZ35113.1 hypothetical protein [Crocinitomicaceae bacterium]
MTFIKFTLVIVSIAFYSLSYCQESIDPNVDKSLEICADFTFGASERGNHFGAGLKLGFKVKEYLIVGPVLRYNRINFLNGSFGVNKSFNSYGGGGFMEMHFAKILFLGFEVNAVNSPFKFTEVFSGSIDLNKELWTINAFISVGVSISVKNQFRLNGCISYDVINRGNSPFYFSYPIYEGGGSQKTIPIMYRLGVSIPIGGRK